MQPSQASNETRLPSAVQRQMARINARRQPAPGAEPGNAVPTDTPPALPAGTAVAPPAEPTAQVDPRESDPNYWKQRFSVTSGLLAKERKETNDRITSLADTHARQITELQDQIRSLQAQAPAPKVDVTKFFTPAQIELYGPEQCEVMAATAEKAAQSKAKELVDAAVRPLHEARERDQTDKAARAKQAFIDALIEAKPDYATIDTDPRWLLWLAEDDENGVQRQQVLNIHIANGNAKAVATMMLKWEKSVALPVPPVSPSGTGAQPDGGIPPPSAPGLTAPTDKEMREFYRDSALGKVTDAERVKFDARLKLRHPARA